MACPLSTTCGLTSARFPPLIFRKICIKMITTVLADTYLFPAGNHSLTELRYTVKYRTSIVIQTCNRCIITIQPIQFWLRYPQQKNTFHIYGICLNRNRKMYSLCNFTQSDSQNRNTTSPKISNWLN